MKKIFYVVTIIVTLVGVKTAHAGDVDLMLRGIMRNTKDSIVAKSWSRALVRHGGQTLIPCFIRTQDRGATSIAISEAGGYSHAISEKIISASIPPGAIDDILARSEVDIAEAGTPLSPKMDTARTASSVDVVQDGSALGVTYQGANVVIGVVDDGLDYGNADFMGTDGFTRIQYVRQTLSGSTLECTKRSIAAGSCAIEDEGQGTYHGTNVTGIAAGSNSTYTGVAPKADIMFVFNSAEDPDTTSGSFATTVLEGVTTIFEKADAIDKPAVVNLSLGTSVGAHDGTSLLEQGLTSLTSAKGGRIVVGAAGNEQAQPASFNANVRNYIGGIHSSVNVGSGSSIGSRMMVLNGRGAASSFSGGTLVDVWLDAGQKDSCSIAAISYTGGRQTPDFSFPGALDTASAALSTADVPFATDTAQPVQASTGGVTATIEVDDSDARNAKPHATVLFAPSSGSGSTLESAWFDIVIRSNGSGACSGHMWLYFDYAPYHDFLKDITGVAIAGNGNASAYTLADGDSLYTMTIPATAVGVIAAGSFMPPKPTGAATSTWTGDDGTTYDQSNINAPGGTGSATNDFSSFSSLGPTADGRTKPDIVAPGEPIVSTKARGATISSALTVGGQHFKEAGTSMSSPHIAGIVALLLERNNTLAIDQVRSALAVGAHTDGMTAKTADPINSYGAGKVNASATLASVSQDTSLYHGTGDLESPDTGSGCTLAKHDLSVQVGAKIVMAIILASALCLYICGRFNRRLQ